MNRGVSRLRWRAAPPGAAMFLLSLLAATVAGGAEAAQAAREAPRGMLPAGERAAGGLADLDGGAAVRGYSCDHIRWIVATHSRRAIARSIATYNLTAAELAAARACLRRRAG